MNRVTLPISIPLFHQPPNGEHDGETSQGHEQRADDKKRRGGHYQAAEKWNQSLLPPAIDHVTTSDGAPDARRPEIMLIEPIILIEQIHCCSICCNLMRLASNGFARRTVRVHSEKHSALSGQIQNRKPAGGLPVFWFALLLFAGGLHRLTVSLHEILLFQPGD